MLKFILDVGVGRKVESFLASRGFDVASILDLDIRMADTDILTIAAREERMVITMDKDFGELVFRASQPHFGVLLLRLEDATGDEKVEVVRQILEGFETEIAGKFCVFLNGKLRIRS